MAELNNFINQNNITESKTKTIQELYKNNNELFQRLDVNFVNSDYFDRLDFFLIQNIVSLDPSIQKSFLNIKGNNRELFLQLINRFSKKYNQFPYVNALLINFNNQEFYNLINSVNLEELTEEDYKNLSDTLIGKKNELNIQSIAELRNKNVTLAQRINNSRNNDIDEYKNFRLIEKTNLSLAEARLICQKYCYDLEHFKINHPLISILKQIKRIVLSTSYEEIDQLISFLNIGKIAFPDFQTLCQQLYEDEFNTELFKPENKEYTIYNGCKIIDAGTKFNMIIRTKTFFQTPKAHYHQENTGIII